MLEQYLMVHKNALPDYFEKVVEARRLLESGQVREVSQAVRMAGISRSTYYKYKDLILEPTGLEGGRKAVLSVMLSHAPGVLSALLAQISHLGGSVITICQSPPIGGQANVTVTLDVSALHGPLEDLMKAVKKVEGVSGPRLIAAE